MPDVFEVLRQDHEEVEQMLAQLEAGPGHCAGTAGQDLEARGKLAEKLANPSFLKAAGPAVAAADKARDAVAGHGRE